MRFLRNPKRRMALQTRQDSTSSDKNIQRRAAMPVILLWAVPAVFVLGGVTYLLVK